MEIEPEDTIHSLTARDLVDDWKFLKELESEAERYC
jgi:hypothetical protein